MKKEMDLLNTVRKEKCQALNRLSEVLGEDSNLECPDLTFEIVGVSSIQEIDTTEIVDHKNGESFYVKAKKFFKSTKNGHGGK